MSAEIINLRQFRKNRERAEREAAAAENRARFGRTRVEREQEEAADAHGERHLAGHRLGDGDPGKAEDKSSE